MVITGLANLVGISPSRVKQKAKSPDFTQIESATSRIILADLLQPWSLAGTSSITRGRSD